ncbi:Myoferlin [Geodia barretti]|uniref:Myoferlin n=1 Tax=Geodia barretti TaxID=519541 RepID=A0AA35RLD8_GEOBA|nr:Myoferlin [Geodia barretti]
MSLSVLVKSASSLPNVEKFSKSDPMCVIVLQGEKRKTKVIDNNLDPQWNETLTWTLQAALSGSESLEIEVYDYEKLRSNRLLGTLSLSLQEVVSRGSQNVNSALKSKKGEVMQVCLFSVDRSLFVCVCSCV